MAKENKQEGWENENLWESVKDAYAGIFHILARHRNARTIFLSAILILAMGFYLKISNLELFVLGVATMVVFIAEVINTLIEDLSDLITREYNPKIKLIKDVAAGVVLVAVGFALSLGYFVFFNRILALWKGV